MVSGRETVQFVLASSVRSGVVDAVGSGCQATDGLLSSLDASTSAVYNALGQLENEGLIRTAGDDDWELTGSGRIVADIVRQHRRCGGLLADAGDYLRNHDTGALPREFRLRAGELEGVHVLRASETEPHRVVTEVTERIDGTETASVISPIYVESYEAAMPDLDGVRLILDEAVARSVFASDGPTASEYENLEVRVAEVNFALAVTDSELLLSLPTLDGSYDPRSEIVAEHDRARRWGRDVFGRYWEAGVPFEQFRPDRES